jgi:hypothetical protein
MVKDGYKLPAASYRLNLGVASDYFACRRPDYNIVADAALFLGFAWKLAAGSWQLSCFCRKPVAESRQPVCYNQGLQRLSGRRSYPACGSSLHPKFRGSDRVLRAGNEPMRNPLLCEDVA